jgi:demethylmenaquinone methyltransferase / 2-methoxy-6-polyprenyl-1,4-benzoquinol methylase
MTGRYYTPGSKRSERVRELFGRIAARYDLINDLQSLGLHRLWKARLVRAARPQPSDVILDACCGTGDIAARLGRCATQVVACDFSPEMLTVGRNRHGERMAWVQADALELPFHSETFDLVTIAYGLRNLSDFHKGVSELLRVLKPGGRLLILDFGKPPNRLLRAAYFGYLRAVVPLFGLLFCRDAAAYSYILDSLREYPAQEGVTGLLREAGCDQVRVENLLGGAMSLHVARKARSLRQSDDVPLEAVGLVR